MFRIYDGRTEFFQWDTNQKLIVEDSDIKEVHFANCLCPNAHVVETYTEGELTLANVPNILFQEHLDINVYAYDGKKTKHAERFEVNKRTKPADYVYTETEEKTFDALVARLEEILTEFNERLTALENADKEIKFYIEGEEHITKANTTWSEAINDDLFGSVEQCPACGEPHRIIEPDDYTGEVRVGLYGDCCINCKAYSQEVYFVRDSNGEKVLGTDTIIDDEYYTV